ncbi:uncharacterized protein [Palaemon carinicauda]|uniref:uncharacterized protein n=1 Tax=Palaemon carinicauda TaxID=392227 RepID=UPI0035B6026A
MPQRSSEIGSSESLNSNSSNDSKDTLFHHSPGDYRYSFGSLFHNTKLQKLAIIFGLLGGVLMLFGMVYGILGIDGYKGLILIVVGAISMVVTVIIASRACFEAEANDSSSSISVNTHEIFEMSGSSLDDLPSVPTNVFQTSVQVHINREMQIPIHYNTTRPSQRRQLRNIYRSSTFFGEELNSSQDPSRNSVVNGPSVPSLKKKRDDPPSYEEIFSRNS